MDASASDQLLRFKIASEVVLGNQAALAFSRAFYLEDLLIDRIQKEFTEIFGRITDLQGKIKQFIADIDSSVVTNFGPQSEVVVRCQCTDMLDSLDASQPSLESFKLKLMHAKARRQAKSCVLEKLSLQNSNISSKFNNLTLNELVNDVHVPEFSCFIQDSDFGELEKLIEEWETYLQVTKPDVSIFEKKFNDFQEDIERNRRIRDYTCDMILAQITQPNPGAYGSETLKKKGVFHKFSTLLRRHSRHHHQSNESISKESSMSQLSVATTCVNSFQHTF